MNIVFRTDASLEIGTGHVVRCLTLARALRDRGAKCVFLCREHPGHLFERIRKEGFEVIALPRSGEGDFTSVIGNGSLLPHAHWLGSDSQTDADQTIATLRNHRADWLIVDHYALDCRWESQVRPYCGKIMAIDDLADRPHDCDLLLDQNLVANKEHRYNSLLPGYCARLLGPEYALLQPDYAELHSRTPPRSGPVQRILVYFGGADNQNLTGLAITTFLTLNRLDITLDVVINPESPYATTLRAAARPHVNITIHEVLPSLAHLMVKADLALGAAGSTSWERCCLGLPALVVTMAENQIPIAAELHRLGLIRWLGDKDAVSVPSLKGALLDVLSDKAPLVEWSIRCRASVNGRGTERVVDLLLLNSSTTLSARFACLDDESLLLTWANDLLVRKKAFSSAPIASETHRTWFYKRLRDPENCQIFILETGVGMPIGQVRFERSDDAWEVSYSLASEARGSGLESQILHTALLAFRESRKGVLVFSRVKSDNFSSQNAFEKRGFSKSTAGGGGSLSLAICSDSKSWINSSIPRLLLEWLSAGHQCAWSHDAKELPGGELCFYLSYGRIVDRETRSKYLKNLVVHASDLPKGRGWSPATWMIVEGKSRIPVTLLEAVDAVDAGPVYAQDWFDVQASDLVDDWRNKLRVSTAKLVKNFVADYPLSLNSARPQLGSPSFYPKRRPKDSEIDLDKPLREQFSVLQVVDNEQYPAYFFNNDKKFILKIFASQVVDK